MFTPRVISQVDRVRRTPCVWTLLRSDWKIVETRVSLLSGFYKVDFPSLECVDRVAPRAKSRLAPPPSVRATPAVHTIILSFEVVPEDHNHDRFLFGRLLRFRQRVSVRGRVHGVIAVRSAPEDQQPLKGQYIGYCSRYLYLQLSFYANDNRVDYIDMILFGVPGARQREGRLWVWSDLFQRVTFFYRDDNMIVVVN